MNSVQVGEVIGDLGVEDPELAIELFYLLKNEHGLRKCSQLVEKSGFAHFTAKANPPDVEF
ncbi:hypothetical protein RHSIM_Rhsim02G0221600 [Rhododendron simsii]|uniref:Uncharacterized protein n=1 Tax=Rhododendron simsii TaxID=118357 RepID=A0A834HEY7_RHOSS|nr:hypothetical protein RHSIM_Rhsim02G0221600 [Rhododendron simsii]